MKSEESAISGPQEGDNTSSAGDRNFGQQRNIGTGGGDYAEGNIDKREGTFFQVDAVHIYPPGAPPSDDPATLAAAQARLAELPLDRVPDPAPLPAGSRMPFSPNPLFVGREGELCALARALKAGATAAIGQAQLAAATGLGGIGKTQLASEFAHRYGQFFAGGVFWLNFADAAAVPTEVAACGSASGPPGFDALKLDDQIRQVLRAWQSAMPRLLVLDNCEDETLLTNWRPPSGGCRVLITSRRARWDSWLGVQALPLDVLSRAQSIALLRKFRPDLAADDVAIDAIAAELGDLPLALHLAGSFLAAYRHARFGAPAAYLSQLRTAAPLAHISLQGEGLETSPTGHVLHVAKTFTLSYQRLNAAESTDGLAIALLARAACFAPGEPIPRELLLQTLMPTDDVDVELQAEKAAQRLVDLGLLEEAADGALRLHRLLAMFVRDLAADEAAQAAVEQAILAEANRLNTAGFPAPLRALYLHLRAITDAAQQRADERAARLSNTLGYYLHMIGDYTAARPYFEQALVINREVLGERHPDTASSLNDLGYLLRAMGDYAATRPYYEQALAIRREVLGERHPDTALSLNNLGALLQAMGDYAAARPYLEQALAIVREVLGERHPDTARSLNNLGMLLQAMGEMEAARPYFEQALAICEARLGMDHPTTRIIRANLAAVLALMETSPQAPMSTTLSRLWRRLRGLG